MTSTHDILAAVLRQDLPSFIRKTFATLCPGERFQPNWHIDALADPLTRVKDERVRLIVNLPPRSLKSIIASVALPAWLLGHDPTRRIIVVSYSDDLARKFARDFRRVVESDWYQRLFPAMRINPRKNTEGEIETERGGYRLAASIGGTLTGRGGNLIIIDDPLKSLDAESESDRRRVNGWYDSTLFSRLDNKETDSILAVMQRLHEDDLTGHLCGKPDGGGFDLLVIPAIATAPQRIAIGRGRFYDRAEGEALHPTREGLATLLAIKASIGARAFNAQYQQAPVPAGGNLFKAEWLKRYAGHPPRDGFDEIVQSWDTAAKVGAANDWSACTTWGLRGHLYHLLDVRRERWEFPDLLRAVAAMAARDRPSRILIEDANAGTALLQSLRLGTTLPVIGIKPRLDKLTRAAQQSAQLEAGRVLLPDEAAWLADFEQELLAFPNGRHDDQVDSLVQFLLWAADREDDAPPIVAAQGVTRESYWLGLEG